MTYNALVIGCGKIGAGYDWDNEEVLTHSKALYLTRQFKLSFFDQDIELAAKVAFRYNGIGLQNLNDGFDHYDLVTISSSTSTHGHYLAGLLGSRVKVILCEKPLSLEPDEIAKVDSLYRAGKKPVFINYIRRFQPAYQEVRSFVFNTLKTESLKFITIRYCRGFINNGSHAIDTLEFLFDKSVELRDIVVFQKKYDVFSDDPTLSLCGNWDSSVLTMIGIADASISIFEIDLFFTTTVLRISKSGDSIEASTPKNGSPTSIFKREGAIKDYMVPVVNAVLEALSGTHTSDNFSTSARVNQKMIHWTKAGVVAQGAISSN